MKKLKRFIIVLLIMTVAFVCYVAIVNQNSKNMTYRQKVLKAVYPALMWVNKITGGRSKVMSNNKQSAPSQSLYDLSIQLNNGTELKLETLKGKKILLVNTASDCGYTDQYDDLQKIYDINKDKLVVIGFPANDFKEQEKGNDNDIAAFCKKNYGITFPLATKSSVVRGEQQNEIFRWLSDKKLNGWNDQQPTWNFSKYLVNEKGVLTNYFDPAVSPASDEIKNAIDQ
ncbi:MAG: glutathione peroxidase [Chitinophagaceae bacterium]